MHLRQIAGTCVLAVAVTLSAPALAHDKHKHRDTRPEWLGDRGPGYGPEFGEIRERWLIDCRGRVADRGGRMGGDYAPPPPISGPLPPPGAMPPPSGMMAPPMAPDACETALDNYYATYGRPGYGYAGPGTIMVPVTIPARPCVETVTTNYTPPARRIIPRRPAPRPDKRIRDKRIKI